MLLEFIVAAKILFNASLGDIKAVRFEGVFLKTKGCVFGLSVSNNQMCVALPLNYTQTVMFYSWLRTHWVPATQQQEVEDSLGYLAIHFLDEKVAHKWLFNYLKSEHLSVRCFPRKPEGWSRIGEVLHYSYSHLSVPSSFFLFSWVFLWDLKFLPYVVLQVVVRLVWSHLLLLLLVLLVVVFSLWK